MGPAAHRYRVGLQWTGNRGAGTSGYRGYGRDHVLSAPGLPSIAASADRTFHGDADRWNPELLLLGALAECHMMSFLHVAVRHGLVVTGYRDDPEGTLRVNADGSGEFVSAVLRPAVELADPGRRGEADGLHAEAHRLCFIARSLAFPVAWEPRDPQATAVE